MRFLRAYGEALELEVTSSRGGFLVLTDQNLPGWNATVDGEPVELLTANHAFRAVRVPPGTSIVAFDYRPSSLRWGAGISGATVLALIGTALRSRLRRRPDHPT